MLPKLQDLKAELEKHGYLLTVILSSVRDYINKGYDLPSIAQIVDWINLYAHAYYTPWDQKFGISSPLDSKEGANIVSRLLYFLMLIIELCRQSFRPGLPSKLTYLH